VGLACGIGNRDKKPDPRCAGALTLWVSQFSSERTGTLSRNNPSDFAYQKPFVSNVDRTDLCITSARTSTSQTLAEVYPTR
jgi:hypothetical protein